MLPLTGPRRLRRTAFRPVLPEGAHRHASCARAAGIGRCSQRLTWASTLATPPGPKPQYRELVGGKTVIVESSHMNHHRIAQHNGAQINAHGSEVVALRASPFNEKWASLSSHRTSLQGSRVARNRSRVQSKGTTMGPFLQTLSHTFIVLQCIDSAVQKGSQELIKRR